MKKRTALLTALFVLSVFPVLGQTRMIAHVSRTAGGFTPEIIVTNTSNMMGTYLLEAYQSSGAPLVGAGGTIGANTTYYRSLQDLFGSDDVSHILVGGDDGIRVSISYEGTSGQASPVHVHETNVQSQRWQVYPGNWNVVWDGFAIVNAGNAAANVTIKQVDNLGATIASNTSLTNIAPLAKRLFVLGDNFSASEDTHFVIEATQPVALTSLRGSKASSGFSFLWENAAIGPVASSASAMMPGVEFARIEQTSVDLRSQGAQNLGSITVSAPGPGFVVVRFDGMAYCDAGDDVVLAVSPVSQTWFSNDGNVSVEGNGSFSHSLVFEIDAAGDFTYYAVGENFIMTGGSGIESVYGSLTATFFPVRY